MLRRMGLARPYIGDVSDYEALRRLYGDYTRGLLDDNPNAKKELTKRISELRADALALANVVFATLSQCGVSSTFGAIHPDVVFINEAAKSMEMEFMNIRICTNQPKSLCAGQSWFAQCVASGLKVHTFTTQHRMHPSISSVVSELSYHGKLRDSTTVQQASPTTVNLTNFNDGKFGIRSASVMLDISKGSAMIGESSRSHTNAANVTYVCDLVIELHEIVSIPATDIVILSAYHDQYLTYGTAIGQLLFNHPFDDDDTHALIIDKPMAPPLPPSARVLERRGDTDRHPPPQLMNFDQMSPKLWAEFQTFFLLPTSDGNDGQDPTRPIQIPGVKILPFPYQLYAVYWMFRNSKGLNHHNGFVADEMASNRTMELVLYYAINAWILVCQNIAHVDSNPQLHCSPDNNNKPNCQISCPSQSLFPIQCWCIKSGVTANLIPRNPGPVLLLVSNKQLPNWVRQWTKIIAADKNNKLLGLRLFVANEGFKGPQLDEIKHGSVSLLEGHDNLFHSDNDISSVNNSMYMVLTTCRSYKTHVTEVVTTTSFKNITYQVGKQITKLSNHLTTSQLPWGVILYDWTGLQDKRKRIKTTESINTIKMRQPHNLPSI
ncbi:hypothetical protein EMCG_08969 [[Emmonsia] crescens]|uniref:Uncharacterized protein n=1 Tax=[Emmonsia] crescens TaxID=73230 RepID=A0A0G2J3P5_9EURO|nr:hypothetical protein EMCG_08969 [Emmonsia crescens UAMH 3008]